MGLLISGDIYIKIQPDIIKEEEKLQKKQEELYEIDFEEAHNGVSDYTQQRRKIIEKEIDLLEIGKLVYDFTDRVGQKIIHKTNIKELKEKYMRLMDFLKEAEYVGKEFIRTVPILTENGIDTSYWNQNPYESIIILYKTDYAMLAHHKNEHSNNLEMIKPEYINDGKYSFIGNQKIMYSDKKETYKEVVDEIENRYQYYKKYYKNK